MIDSKRLFGYMAILSPKLHLFASTILFLILLLALFHWFVGDARQTNSFNTLLFRCMYLCYSPAFYFTCLCCLCFRYSFCKIFSALPTLLLAIKLSYSQKIFNKQGFVHLKACSMFRSKVTCKTLWKSWYFMFVQSTLPKLLFVSKFQVV